MVRAPLLAAQVSARCGHSGGCDATHCGRAVARCKDRTASRADPGGSGARRAVPFWSRERAARIPDQAGLRALVEVDFTAGSAEALPDAVLLAVLLAVALAAVFVPVDFVA